MNISFSSTLSFAPSPTQAIAQRGSTDETADIESTLKGEQSAERPIESNKSVAEANNSKQPDAEGQDDKRDPEGSEAAKRAALSDPNSALFKELEELKKRDREVRTHEMAHLAAAGQHARGGPVYEFKRGPDGQRYAVGGHVNIDTSAIPGDPQATLRKADTIRRAALAPAEPSPQDRRVASLASSMAVDARQEIAQLRLEEIKRTSSNSESPALKSEESEASTDNASEDARGQLEGKIRASGATKEIPPALDLVA